MAQFILMSKLNRYRCCGSVVLIVAIAGILSSFANAGGRPNFPPANFSSAPRENIALGQLLFYDKILSGNRNIACATCHHPKFGTSDGVSLALGEGATGLGTARRVDPEAVPEQRIGRNAPALFNLGAAEFTSLFHDGRLERDAEGAGGVRTPLAAEMAQKFNSVLSAQAMFPVLSGDEMAGQYSENDVSKAVRKGLLAQVGGAWDIIALRVDEIPEYRRAFDGIVGTRPIKFTDIANMIADFIAFEWRADQSPFDRYLAGDTLPVDATKGLDLFYGKAGCATCHAGRFQTDHDFHAIAMPQIGPGKSARFEGHNRDIGRMRVTGDPSDIYRFRTPSLRNITATAPYGHDGAYATLEAVLRHHLDPVTALYSYDRTQAILPALSGAQGWTILEDANEMALIAEANELAPMVLDDYEVKALLAFLQALTDDVSLVGRMGIPNKVPSGLSAVD